jgi:WD40 repeat protein
LVSGRGQYRLRGLSGQIETIATSKDGRRLAALAHNWQIGLWDVNTGQLQAVFQAPPGAYADNAGLAFSPDGRRLAYAVSSQHSGAACLWNLDTLAQTKRWKLPPGLQNKVIFDDEGRLWHFQVEVQNGRFLPDSSLPWQDHPRVGRIRKLTDAVPTKVLAEVKDFNRHFYKVVAAADGQHLVIEGIGNEKGDGRWVKIVDLTTGKPIWSHDVRRKNVAAQLTLESSGHAFYFTPALSEPALRISVPGGERSGSLPKMPEAASDGGDYFCLGSEGGKLTCFLRRNDAASPAVHLFSHTDVVALAFERGRARFVWGGRDGSVVVCELPEIRSRLDRLGLAW